MSNLLLLATHVRLVCVVVVRGGVYYTQQKIYNMSHNVYNTSHTSNMRMRGYDVITLWHVHSDSEHVV